MQEIIEKLLILQDRDRRILRVSQELGHIGPEREGLRARAAATQNSLEAAKLRTRQIESERKQKDLEIEAKKTQIEKYLNQQLLTRKNEEYKALTHEIEMAKDVIFKIEDAQIVLMEQAEVAQKDVARTTAEAAAAKLVDDQIGLLNQREENLKKELAELQTGRAALAGAVDDSARNRYERLFKNKGENVVVGIEHSSCGGCHMKLTAQIIQHCRAQSAEIVTCPNCARILYFTHDMSLTAAE